MGLGEEEAWIRIGKTLLIAETLKSYVKSFNWP